MQRLQEFGQCVAAAHVAKNWTFQGARRAQSKSYRHRFMSLGKAIASFHPTANAKSETKKANKQADDDMKESSS